MNYADIKKIDVANGEGVRVSIFVSGLMNVHGTLIMEKNLQRKKNNKL